ncbi:MAG: IS1595 family transposase [Deltaproteobacteria bacterium]|nr:IS1595 family transposase [Deltaproteobacteria bacterium]MBI3390466.1 IS1595 family transposase [Deltaproteobacteria bacterium]
MPKKKERTGTGPQTLAEAIKYFADPAVAFDHAKALRWPSGVVKCPRCDSADVWFLASTRTWKCKAKHPQRKFSVKIGSIMEDSPLGLDTWLAGMWMIGNCKNGISSYEIHRGLGITQKSAWFLLQRIRLAMQTGTFAKMGGSGPVEADETFIGGKARNMHKHIRKQRIRGTGGVGKELVMGLLDRETGKVHVKHVADRKKKTLQAEVTAHVEPGAEIFTDELASYTGLDREFVHEFVNHAESYVRGNVHTNGIENFWSLLKRALKGTYVSVEPFHLHRYLDEQAFRYNERKHEDGDSGRFDEVLSGAFGKRLTYKQLIGDGGQAITS